MVATAEYSVYGSAASSVAGLATTIVSMREQARQMRALERAAEQEIGAALAEGREIERVAYQRAFAALADIAMVDAVSEANIRALEQEARYAEGDIIAATAGSGLAFVGSPVLAAAAVSGEKARAVGYENIRRAHQKKAFQFEVDEELYRAQQARLAAVTTAEGIQSIRDAQAASLAASSLRQGLDTLQQSVRTVGSPSVLGGLTEGYRHFFPQRTALMPSNTGAQ